MTQLLQYDRKHPPVVNACSGSPIEHKPGCDGECGGEEMNELQVELWNELVMCHREGMAIQGVPTSLTHVANGFAVEVLELDLRVTAMIEYFKQSFGIEAAEKMNEIYARIKIDKLRMARKQFKMQKLRPGPMQPPGIFGPDGHTRLN